MMETMELLPGITLHCFRDSRFKQGCLSLQILREMDEAEAAMNALIPSVLLRGTRKQPDLRAITMRLDDLYGAAVSPLVRRIGDYHSTGFYCSMMDDRFALPGDRVLEPMLQFVGELLLDSPLSDGGFLPEFVESEKKNMISAIESELNDKRAYAMSKLLKNMCKGDSFGVSRLGEKTQVEAIEPKKLYDHYRSILRTSPIVLFYVGSAPIETVAGLLTPLFRDLPRAVQPLAPQSALHPSEGSHRTEIMEVAQGKLCMGFTTPITNRMPEFPAMQIMNTIFGAGMTSKLFQNVREKQSLCYSIGSAYYSSKGVMVVSAGIDFDKETHVRQQVLEQLDACRRGEISDSEINAAKQALISSLRGTHDSPSAIEGYYNASVIGGMDMTPQQYIQAVESVTAEQIAAAANTVTLHSTYFLKGADQ